jgi:chemotaxis signal transduction protein
MTVVVRFRTGDGHYAVPVEHAREVVSAEGMVPIPAAAPGVVGLLRRDTQPLTVLETLGSGSDHVLVLDDGTDVFGLHVEEVSGVVTVEDGSIGPAPSGQHGDVVSAVLDFDDAMTLLVDVHALARTLRA